MKKGCIEVLKNHTFPVSLSRAQKQMKDSKFMTGVPQVKTNTAASNKWSCCCPKKCCCKLKFSIGDILLNLHWIHNIHPLSSITDGFLLDQFYKFFMKHLWLRRLKFVLMTAVTRGPARLWQTFGHMNFNQEIPLISFVNNRNIVWWSRGQSTATYEEAWK